MFESLSPKNLFLLRLSAVFGLTLKQTSLAVGMTEWAVCHAFRRMYDTTGAADHLELVCWYAHENLAPKGS